MGFLYLQLGFATHQQLGVPISTGGGSPSDLLHNHYRSSVLLNTRSQDATVVRRWSMSMVRSHSNPPYSVHWVVITTSRLTSSSARDGSVGLRSQLRHPSRAGSGKAWGVRSAVGTSEQPWFVSTAKITTAVGSSQQQGQPKPVPELSRAAGFPVDFTPEFGQRPPGGLISTAGFLSKVLYTQV